MQFLKISFLCGSILFLNACKQDTKPATPASPTAATPTTASTTTPEVYLYRVDFNDVLLRDQPSQKGSKALSKLKEGDLVVGKGEVSANKEAVTLRDIPYNEPFIKITTTTPEQASGWIYGAALRLIYAGSNAEKPDMGKLAQLSATLNALNPKQLPNGKKAWDYVNANFSDAKGPIADAAYILLLNFLNRMEYDGQFYVLTEKVNWTDEDYTNIANNTMNMDKYPATKQLAENGFTIDQGEGMVFPITDWKRMSTFFSPKVTPAMRDYLALEMVESKDPDSEDGGMAIEMTQLVDRAVSWEKFNQQYPYFVNSSETKHSAEYHLLSVINGMNNTPVYDGETQLINDDFKKGWTYAQEKYAGTTVARHCKEISDLFAASGWKQNAKAEAYQTELANKLIPQQ